MLPIWTGLKTSPLVQCEESKFRFYQTISYNLQDFYYRLQKSTKAAMPCVPVLTSFTNLHLLCFCYSKMFWLPSFAIATDRYPSHIALLFLKIGVLVTQLYYCYRKTFGIPTFAIAAA